jgi:hypothetical protein
MYLGAITIEEKMLVLETQSKERFGMERNEDRKKKMGSLT